MCFLMHLFLSGNCADRENPLAPIRCNLTRTHKMSSKRDYHAGCWLIHPTAQLVSVVYNKLGLPVCWKGICWETGSSDVLLLETDESDSYLFQKVISEMHICWLLVALIVSGEFCQIGSFKGGKAIESFDVKQDC